MPMQVADAFVRLVADSTGLTKSVQTEAGKAGDTAGRTFGDRFKSAFSPAKVGAVIGAGFGVAGIAALKFGDQVDDAYDSIRIGTGATGEALAGLEGDFRAVAGSVTDDIGTVGQVIADLNTRTGQTGEGLQDLSKRILDLSRITGTDATANVATLTRVFGDWSIATEDQGETLDALFRASQATGIGIDQLGGSIVQFGAPLRQLGFSFEQSAGLLGKFEKEGVNSELVMGSLRIALGKMARESSEVDARTIALEASQKAYKKAVKESGEGSDEAAAALAKVQVAQEELDKSIAAADVPQYLQEQVQAIKDAGTAGEANALALELFGARAGPDMAAAIREGRFELGDLFDTIESGSETIDKAVADTDDAGDLLGRAINGLKVQFGDLFTGLAGITDALGPMTYVLLPTLTSGLGAVAGKAAGAAGSIVGRLIPALTGSLIPAIAGLVPAIGGALTGMFSAAVGILGAAIPVIMAALPFIIIGAIVAAIAILILNEDIRNAVFDFLGGILEWVGEVLGGLVEVIGNAFSTAFNAVVGFVSDVFGSIGDIISTAIGLWVEWVLLWPLKVLEALNMVLGFIGDFIGQAIPAVQAFVGQVVNFFLSIPGRVVGIIQQLLGFFGRIASGVVAKVAEFVANVVRTVLSIPGKVVGLIGEFGNIAKRMVDAFLGFIGSIPGKVADILGGIGDFVGGLIPKFAVGIENVPQDMLAIVHKGEMIVPANEAEAVRQGRRNLGVAEPPAPAGAGVGGGLTVNVYNPEPEAASTSVDRELRKLAYLGVPA